MVLQLHAMNNQIIIISRTQNNWEKLKNLQPAIRCIQCDLSKKDDVLQLIKAFDSENTQIDMYINNAALQFTPKLTDPDFEFDTIEQETTTNFTAVVWLSSLLLPQLLRQKEALIVNISSGLAFAPKSSSAVYCATKAALHSISQSLRYQLTNTPIQVVEVILPMVDTPMTQGRNGKKISAKFAAEQIIKGITRGDEEIYVGKARFLPMMMRICPGLVKRMLSKY